MPKSKTQVPQEDNIRAAITKQGPLPAPRSATWQTVPLDTTDDVYTVSWQEVSAIPLLVGDLETVAAFDNLTHAIQAGEARGGIAVRWHLCDLLQMCQNLNMRLFRIPKDGDGSYLRFASVRWGEKDATEDEVPF